MEESLLAFEEVFVSEGFVMALDPTHPTDLEERNSHLNAQAMNALFGALNVDEFN